MGVDSTLAGSKDNVVKNYPYESIECADCGGEAVNDTTSIEESYDNKEFTIINVPAFKCVQCGEYFISTTVMSEASKLAKNHFNNTGEVLFDYNTK